ncbi:hypothetical protein QAD02_004249 [Eretmocerus hayati]|uniref:Uncharacterized protein n=1 Tax=Eretmocerus hayati TaxID=131215 RepID=A0ACC2NQ33_9HYME|nr:hypothetical protein QAD02_004249 [Eretmocerus hayati]
MPATHIRGKCCVTLLNETESLLSYLNKDDSFFYCLVFDPAQRTLLADKGEIRVGSRYQADNIAATPLTMAEREADPRKLQDLETLTWTPRHSLTDRQIDQFLVVSRSVGTFARALDCSSSVKQPSLHMSAAAASRDITLFHAMDTLHRHNYDVAKAMSSLVPSSGPVLCRDEMEEWSASEANLFEEALDKYGKDFSDIRSDFVPWKTLKNVIEYYYMWKTTDRYVQQKRVKAVEAESKLKQVYIPNYNKGGSGSIGTATGGGAQIIPLGNSNGAKINILNGSSNGADAAMLLVQGNGKPCEGCQTNQSGQWYAWGPTHMQCRLCQGCWNYWKKYGGLKVPSRIDDGNSDERKRSGGAVTPGSNSGGLATTPTGIAPGSGAGSDDEGGKLGVANRPHRCGMPSCGKEFKLKAHLSRHYASAHGVELRAGTPGSGPPLGAPQGAAPILSSVVAAAAGMPLAAAALGLGAAAVGVLPGGGSPRPVMKTRSAFYLRTSSLARAARRLCAAQLRVRHAARAPHQPINAAPLRHLCASPQLATKTPAELRVLARTVRPRVRPRVTDIASRLGRIEPQPGQPGEWDWLQLTAPSQRKQPEHVSFPKPPKAPDGSLLYERIPNKPDLERLPGTVTPPVAAAVAAGAGVPTVPTVPATQQQGPKQILSTGVALKRPRPPPFDEHLNGGTGAAATATDGAGQAGHPPAKRAHHAQQPGGGPSLNGRAMHPIGPMSRSNARKQVMSWMDAPDDVYFRATDNAKRFRRSLSSVELRRAARKPWRKLNVPQRSTRPDDLVVILD